MTSTRHLAVAAAGGLPLPAFPDVRRCALRHLVETTTHAGQLDIVREGIDGHQFLVVP